MKSREDKAAYIASLDCVHCGLCLEACPTYRLTGRESASPRGRLYLMRAHLEERAPLQGAALEELDRCLVCRACEPVCPSGVHYSEIIAGVREETRPRGRWRRLLTDQIMLRPARLEAIASLSRFAAAVGLLALGRRLPGALGRLARSCPPIPRARDRRRLAGTHPAIGPERGAVAFFEGCVMPVVLGEANRATVRLLQAAGYRVEVPREQVCCGALHEHDGALEVTRGLLSRNAEIFGVLEGLPLISNSAGCGASLKGAGHLLETEPARSLAERTVDLSRFLVENGEALRFRDAAGEGKVTYDAPCHLHHAQRETRAPLEILQRVPGIELTPLLGAEDCCGAAGVYNIDQEAMASDLLSGKLDALASTGARVLLTGNPGCLLQWRRGVRERRLPVRVEHPATFLARLLREEGG